jgi:hypothetical protein
MCFGEGLLGETRDVNHDRLLSFSFPSWTMVVVALLSVETEDRRNTAGTCYFLIFEVTLERKNS